MKNEKNTVQFRIACYMRVGNKEQLSPEERKALHQDDTRHQEACGRRKTLKHKVP